MSNMSYCRFENTASDLRDCEDALEALMNDPRGEDRLSEHELRSAKRLVDTCRRIVEHVADYLTVNVEDMTEAQIEEALNRMQEEAEKSREREAAEEAE